MPDDIKVLPDTSDTAVAVRTFWDGARDWPAGVCCYVAGGSSGTWALQPIDATHPMPASLPNSQITALTPPAAIVGFATETTLAGLAGLDFATEATLDALAAKLATLGQKAMAGSMPVVIASDQSAIPVTATVAVGDVYSSYVLKQRPNDTAAYVTNDVIAESTSAATVWTFPNCARTSGGSGSVIGATCTDSANQTTKPILALHLFTTSPTTANDNAAFAPDTVADLPGYVGTILFSTFNGFASNGALEVKGENIGYVCAATSLYGVLTLAGTGYTPVANEKFGITLKLARN